ncbi:MAG: S8 family serine peptidase [Opitutales bacterium]|nr:S8 family serine peptidase [Opitutales bacterium]
MDGIVVNWRRFLLPGITLLVAALIVWHSGNETEEDLPVEDSPSNGTAPYTPPAFEAVPEDENDNDSAMEEQSFLRENGTDIVVRFSDAAELAAFRRAWEEAHPGTSRPIGQLKALRIQLDSPSALRRLLDNLPQDADTSPNLPVQLPRGPDFDDITATDYQPFTQGLRHWLGATDQVENWGRGITVAVLDTGIADLPGNQAFRQIDLLAETPDARNLSPHGRAVALLLAGEEGLAPASDLLSIRVLDGKGQGDVFTVAEGIVRAADEGAKIINLSLGSSRDHPVLQDAVNYATARGSLLVAAAGNEGRDGLPFPAAYPEVFSVTAIDAERQQANFANRGSIDLAAPGVGVAIPWSEDQFLQMNGTSAASPIVAGAAAALLSEFPDLTPRQAAEVLRQNADDAGPTGPDDRWGQGVISMERSLQHRQQGVHDPAIADIYLHPQPNAEGNYQASITVQNRGTEWSGGLTIWVNDGQKDHSFTINSLDVGESRGLTIPIDAKRVQSEHGVTLKALLESPTGLRDDRPDNNEKAVQFHIEVPE